MVPSLSVVDNHDEIDVKVRNFRGENSKILVSG